MNYNKQVWHKGRHYTLLSISFLQLILLSSLIGCEKAKNTDVGQAGTEAQSNTAAEAPAGSETDDSMSVMITGSCDYKNLFSAAPECRNYTGDGWDMVAAESDCAGQPESTFSATTCDAQLSLGTCAVANDEGLDYELILSGEAPSECQATVQGCVVFARGEFTPTALCEGQYEPVESALPDDVGSVFVPFELMCLQGEESQEGARCTWQAIGGCAPEGEEFVDYASCNPVLTQRPYAPVPSSGFETPIDDPLRSDDDFLTEVEWVRSQAKSCGCVCCHEDSKAPSGAAVWDTDRQGIWTDDWNPNGLAMGAGWIDSSVLGAFPSEDNNGFDRQTTVLPTTDVNRMVRFFEGELARRGFTPEDFADTEPTGGPLYAQRIFEPSQCDNGEGVSTDGMVSWVGGTARYVYILEEGTDNPGTPPNLDRPEGTMWRLDVNHEASAISSARYAEVIENTIQGFPAEGAPITLVEGSQYYIYVLRDIGSPITRCLFTYGASTSTTDPAETIEGPWNQVCTQSEECAAPTDFCVKSPGEPEGYCSVHCNSAAACNSAGAPEAWGCVAVNCAAEAFTWCGDPIEIEESGGFLSLCP